MRDRTQAVIAELSEMIYDQKVPRDRRKDLAREVGQALGVATEMESPTCTEAKRSGLEAELERHLRRAKDIADGKPVPVNLPRIDIDSYTVTVV
jgi:hypothetical protein